NVYSVISRRSGEFSAQLIAGVLSHIAVRADTWTSSSRLRFNGVINRGGEKEWGQSRAEPSSTDKSRKFLTNSVHAADSDLSSERF
ncbi:hypothetical protein J6590_084965, partial [Homalodisca vitripennis]